MSGGDWYDHILAGLKPGNANPRTPERDKNNIRQSDRVRFIDAPVATFEFSHNRIVHFRNRTRTGPIWLRFFVQEQAVHVLVGSSSLFSICRPSRICSLCRRPHRSTGSQTGGPNAYGHRRGRVDQLALRRVHNTGGGAKSFCRSVCGPLVASICAYSFKFDSIFLCRSGGS